MLVKSALFTRKTHSRADEHAELLQRLSPENAYEGNSSGAASVPLWIDAYDNRHLTFCGLGGEFFLTSFLQRSILRTQTRRKFGSRSSPSARAVDRRGRSSGFSQSKRNFPSQPRTVFSAAWLGFSIFLAWAPRNDTRALIETCEPPVACIARCHATTSGYRELGVK
jgi:hypothetical protein